MPLLNSLERPAVVEINRSLRPVVREDPAWDPIGKSQSGQRALAKASLVGIGFQRDLEGTSAPEQHVVRSGVEAALCRFFRDQAPTQEEKKHFLIADGTGTGKGFQVVLASAIASEWSDLPALIATRADLLPGLKRDAQRLGLLPKDPLSDHETTAYSSQIEYVSFEALSAHLERARIEGKEYALIALDEAQDIPRNPLLKQAMDAAPTRNILFLTATPYISKNEAVYFTSRLLNRSEADMDQFMGEHLSQISSKLEAVNALLAREGRMIRREYPFWGENGKLVVRAMTSEQTQEEITTTSRHLARLEHCQTMPELDAIQLHYQKEMRALSDEALIDHAIERIQFHLSASPPRKVIFYGSDTQYEAALVVSPSSSRSRDYLGLLTGLQEGLEARGIEVARLQEDSTSVNGDMDGQWVRESNAVQADRFTDRQLIDAEGNEIKGVSGDPIMTSDCRVILLPASQSAGWSHFCQRSREASPVVVISSLPESADDLLQQEGRVSRISSQGPSQAEILCLDSTADQERMDQLAMGLDYLRSAGSLAAHSHQNLRIRYQEQSRLAQLSGQKSGTEPDQSTSQTVRLGQKFRHSQQEEGRTRKLAGKNLVVSR